MNETCISTDFFAKGYRYIKETDFVLAVCRSWSLGPEEAVSSTIIVDVTILGTSTGA